MKTNTIAAVATAMSNAGISIVRMSGEKAFEIIDKVYRSKSGKKRLSEQLSHTVHYGYIVDGEKVIDEVLVVIMRGPNSYTKEDVVEINCHGGVIVTKKILETLIQYGARPAEPGEFTKRAFLNGRIDLSQAEAVSDIIHAKNEYAVESSVSQLRGAVLREIKKIRENIILDIAFIEAALDDPEHISIDGFAEELLKRVCENKKELEKLLRSSEDGRILTEGIRTVIMGKPNAGKSSFLNVLVGEEKAIVTEIEGTTRDALEETIRLDNIVLNMVDTAGIRNTEDIVEKIGVEKATKYAHKADLILYMVDSSRDLDENDMQIIDMLKGKKAIVLLNKSDLQAKISSDNLEQILKERIQEEKSMLSISAKNESGMEAFKALVKKMFYDGKLSFNDEVYITNIRQKTAIAESIESLKQVEKSIESGMPEDFYSIDLMNAYEVLGQIIGESVGEDLVNTIFGKFCMGK